MMTATQFANRIGHSDVEPFEVIRSISEKTIEIRRMDAKLDPNWKPEMHVGGFAAHCSNQHTQTYTYSSVETNEIVRIRLRKDGRWYDNGGNRYNLEDSPRKFYDYNF